MGYLVSTQLELSMTSWVLSDLVLLSFNYMLSYKVEHAQRQYVTK